VRRAEPSSFGELDGDEPSAGVTVDTPKFSSGSRH
jgi:hypothetical protein